MRRLITFLNAFGNAAAYGIVGSLRSQDEYHSRGTQEAIGRMFGACRQIVAKDPKEVTKVSRADDDTFTWG